MGVVKTAVISGTAGTPTEVVADPGAGKYVKLHAWSITLHAAGTAQWTDGAGSPVALTGAVNIATASPWTVYCPQPIECTVSEALKLAGVTGNVRGVAWYSIEDA